ncbi:hypothetical protein E3C22_16685 [Jiella endophytica]|uniref:Bacteriophage tail tape measure N-terminal domain-containing protein n=1 Tax=Jiella endophytica TaxID=2558362 RepID=A0A4Y8REP0_9HYPH|nr:phage tail length tape measure family protein [Jiella endophytica]TFF20544.1 hypothetical protein E3C22_16685 [Jiella endophytica]
MVQPLQFSMVMTLDAKGVGQGAREARQEISATGQAAKSAGGDLGTMTTAMQAEAAAARQVKDALTGATGAEAAYRQELQRRVGANQNLSGRAPTPAAGGGAGAGGLPPTNQTAMLDQVRERYNPLYKIGQDYKRTLGEIAAAERTAGLAVSEANVYRRQAAELAERQMRALMRGERNQPTSGGFLSRVGFRPDQGMNLLRQGGDVGTMALMGASASQILTSQGFQIAEVFADAEGGAKKALKGIGQELLGLTRFVNPLTIGLTAAGGAVLYFATRSSAAERSVEASTKATAAYVEALKDVKMAAGDAAEGAGRIFERETRVSETTARAQMDAALKAQRDARQAAVEAAGSRLSRDLLGSMGGLGDNNRQRQFALLDNAITRLEDGTITAKQFREEISAIRVDGNLSRPFRDVADALEQDAKAAVEAEARVDSLKGAVEELHRVAAQRRLGDAMEALRGYVPDLRTPRQRIAEDYSRAIGAIDSIPRFDNARGGEGERAAADAQRQKALEELTRQEEIRRRGVLLDIAATGARTTAERAAIESARAFNQALADPSLEDHERQLRANEAALRVYAEAQREATDALQGAVDDLALAGLEGAARELAAINQEVTRQIALNPQAADSWRAYGEARRAALEIETNRNLFRPQEEERAEIEALAAALGKSTAERRRIMTDLKSEQELRRAGIDLTSREAEAYRRNARALADWRANVEKSGKALDDLQATGLDAIDKLVDGITDLDEKADFEAIFGDIAKDFAKQFIDLSVRNPLKNLAGGDLPTLSDIGGFEGLWATITGKAVPKPQAPTIALAERGATPFNPLFVSLVGSGLPGSIGGGLLAPAGASAATVGGVTRGGALAPVTALDPASRRVAEAFSVTAPAADGLVPIDQMADYIRQAAAARGIDPETALRVARSEGLGEGIWQSNYRRGSYREPSYGPFQLLKGGPGTGFGQGLGNAFMRETGLDPADPRNAYSGVDYALNRAARNGWSDWYGAAKVGVGRWDGLAGAQALPFDQAAIQKQIEASPSALSRSAEALAPAATQFQTGFDGALNQQLLGGLGSAVDQFLPGWGGILQKLLSQMGGGGGLGALFGGDLGLPAMPAYTGPGPAGFYDTGGYTGPGPRHKVSGYVHAGEVVWNQDDVAAAGGPAAAEAIRIGMRAGAGYERGGVVAKAVAPSSSRLREAAQSSASGGPSKTVVNVNNYGKDGAEVSERTDSNGDRIIDVTIRRVARDEVTRRGTPTNRALRAGGLQMPVTIR